MDTSGIIVLNPDVLGGKPTVKGTRLSVELVMGLVNAGFTNDAPPRNSLQIDAGIIAPKPCRIKTAPKVIRRRSSQQIIDSVG